MSRAQHHRATLESIETYTCNEWYLKLLFEYVSDPNLCMKYRH